MLILFYIYRFCLSFFSGCIKVELILDFIDIKQNCLSFNVHTKNISSNCNVDILLAIARI